MIILTLEGLKGSGKSSIIKKVSGMGKIMPKFSKGITPYPNFLENFKQDYKKEFNNIDSSLGLQFYANFFNNLVFVEWNIICDRGLLSLPYFGYYGYINNQESIPLKEYWQICEELFREAIRHYKPWADISTFIILECTPDILIERINKRNLIASDIFFLKNIDYYLKSKEKYESIAKKILTSNFINLRNETNEDLESIIIKFEDIVI